MRRPTGIIAIVTMLVAIVLATGRTVPIGAQAGTPAAVPDATPGATTTAVLEDAQQRQVGTATLSEGADGVTISVEVDPGVLEPGEHGVHVHETGVCDPSGDTPFASAGGHFNPTGASHGGPDDPDAHAGDLGNLTAGDDGSVDFRITTDRFSLDELRDEDGSALVIHADRDDLQTDPAGNSGARVVCGVIFPPAEEATPAAAGTPAAGAQAPTEVTVEMVDIDFNPNEFTIPAGTDVTVRLPNNGAIVHNFHVDALGVHSEDVQPGQETTVTINAEPGDYEYYCSIPGHRQAGMVGTLHVE